MSEVSFGLDVLSDAQILGPFLQKRIDHLLGLLLLQDSRSPGCLPPLCFLFFWHLRRQEERAALSVFKHKESSIRLDLTREAWELFLEIRNCK